MGYDKLYWYYRRSGEQIISSQGLEEIIKLFSEDYEREDVMKTCIFYTGGGGADEWWNEIHNLKGEELFRLMYNRLKKEVK